MNKCIPIILFCILSYQVNARIPSLNSKDSLVVSFISIGAGTDYKAKERLKLFVEDFQREQHIQLNVSVKHWGREGEIDYVYDLKNLSKKQCKDFVKKIEEMFSKNSLVKISHSVSD